MSTIIKDFSDIKTKYAKLIRQYELDKIDDKKFRSLIYGLSSYANVISKYELEQRVINLEEKAGIK